MKMNNTRSIIAYKSWLKWASFFLLCAKGLEYLFYEKDIFNLSAFNSSFFGVPLILCAVLLSLRSKKFNQLGAFVSFLILFTDNCDSFYQSSYLPHQFVEHTLMMFTPLLYVLSEQRGLPSIIRFLKIAVALTFIGHGVFAVSWNVIPAHFTAMSQYILGLEQNEVKVFLLIMGILDFIAAFLIFTKKQESKALLYMIIWGVLTSLARFIYGFESDLFKGVLGTFYRFPHFLVPFVVLMFAYSKRLSHSSSLP